MFQRRNICFSFFSFFFFPFFFPLRTVVVVSYFFKITLLPQNISITNTYLSRCEILAALCVLESFSESVAQSGFREGFGLLFSINNNPANGPEILKRTLTRAAEVIHRTFHGGIWSISLSLTSDFLSAIGALWFHM